MKKKTRQNTTQTLCYKSKVDNRKRGSFTAQPLVSTGVFVFAWAATARSVQCAGGKLDFN